MERVPTLEVLHPPGWAPAVGYANGIAVSGGRIVFVAGQVGWDAQQRFASDDIVAQFAQALRNVLAVVEAAGGESGDIARLTLYVLDRDEYAAARGEIGRHYRELMGRHYPAMTLVEVRGLLEPGARLEIEATAGVP